MGHPAGGVARAAEKCVLWSKRRRERRLGMADDYTTPVSTTGYVYDELNRLVLVDEEPSENPEDTDGQTKYAYDAVGNRSVVVYPNGTCTAYTYDNLNRLTGMVNRTYEGGGLTVCPESGALLSQFDYTLGAAGNRTQVDELVLEADGTLRKRTVKYEYDNLYRLTKETVIDDTDLPGINPDPQVRTVRSFTYDRVGNRLTEQFVTSTDTTTYGYTYDDQGMDRLTNKTQSVSVVSNIGPEDLPHYAGARPAPSRWAGRSFLGYVALTMVSLFAPLALLGFRTRRLGRRQARRRRRRAAVAAVLIPLLVVGPEHVFALYQEAMARRAMSEALTAAVLAQTGGEVTWTYGYDNNGNMVLRTDGTHVDLYHYDAENRLGRVEEIADVNVDPTLVPTFSYEYDADGVRKSKADLDPDTGNVTNVTTYLADKNRPYAQVLVESTAANSQSPATVDVTYTYGDDLISQTRSGTESYYLYDGQMSVRQLTDSPADPQTTPAVVTDSYTFEAYGSLAAESHAGPATSNNYLYTGEQYDPNLVFYYLRARYYDQTSGRFASRDPVDGFESNPLTLHRYLYAQGQPVSKYDPSGQSTIAQMSSLMISALMFIAFAPNVANAPGPDDFLVPDQSGNLIGAGFGALLFAPLFVIGGRFVGRFIRGRFRLPETAPETRWNAANGPGPLGAERAATFRSASYTEEILEEPLSLYRVYGGDAPEVGPWWSRTRSLGAEQARMDLGLLPEWGNTAANVAEIHVPAGTVIYEGAAARQGIYLGGGNQVFIPEVLEEWLVSRH